MAKKKRSKLTKAQAKELALRKKKQRQMTWALVGIGGVAVVVVLILMAMTGGGERDRTGTPERVEMEQLLDGDYPTLGVDDAPVTIVEFTDYNCGYCRDYALDEFPRIDEEFIASGQVKYVIRPYALSDGSLPIVEAAACARDQGGFWDFHHSLFANSGRFSLQQPPSEGLLRELAEANSLDADILLACVDEGRHRADVQASTDRAKAQIGVNSTPTIYVNGVRTGASFENIRDQVRATVSNGQE